MRGGAGGRQSKQSEDLMLDARVGGRVTSSGGGGGEAAQHGLPKPDYEIDET